MNFKFRLCLIELTRFPVSTSPALNSFEYL